MAARKPGKVAAPVKQKLRKNHGPKRNMFSWAGPMKWQFSQTKWTIVKAKDKNGKTIHITKVNMQDSMLSKYYDFESFQLSCQSHGIRAGIEYMWEEFCGLCLKDRKEYLKNLKDHAAESAQKIKNK